MLLKNKFLPYIAFLGFFLLGLSGAKDLSEYITLVIFCTLLSSVSYMLAVKKYKPIIAWLISITFLYFAIYVYFHTFRILLKPFVGKKGLRKKALKNLSHISLATQGATKQILSVMKMNLQIMKKNITRVCVALPKQIMSMQLKFTYH